MKQILSLLTVLLFCVQPLIASPLVFKVTKVVNSDELFEIANFDASKFKQIRIGVKVSGRLPYDKQPTPKSSAVARLNFAKRDLQRKLELLESGTISRSEYDKANLELKSAQEDFDKSTDLIYPNLNIFGIEGNEDIFLNAFNNKSDNFSFVLETPPSRISIKVFGQATYTIFVWGSL